MHVSVYRAGGLSEQVKPHSSSDLLGSVNGNVNILILKPTEFRCLSCSQRSSLYAAFIVMAKLKRDSRKKKEKRCPTWGTAAEASLCLVRLGALIYHVWWGTTTWSDFWGTSAKKHVSSHLRATVFHSSNSSKQPGAKLLYFCCVKGGSTFCHLSSCLLVWFVSP